MATENQKRYPHLFPLNTRSTEGYTAKKAVVLKAAAPHLQRAQHAQELRVQFAQVEATQRQRVAEHRAAGVQTAFGIQIEFESQPGVELAGERVGKTKAQSTN